MGRDGVNPETESRRVELALCDGFARHALHATPVPPTGQAECVAWRGRSLRRDASSNPGAGHRKSTLAIPFHLAPHLFSGFRTLPAAIFSMGET